MHVFSGLPSGRYHLIIDADRPGKEGGVVVQLSAVGLGNALTREPVSRL